MVESLVQGLSVVETVVSSPIGGELLTFEWVLKPVENAKADGGQTEDIMIIKIAFQNRLLTRSS